MNKSKSRKSQVRPKRANNNGPVILVADIETAPMLAHVWGIWQQNVGMNQIMEEDTILSFAYKYLGDKYTYYTDLRSCTEKQLAKNIRDMLDEADIIVGHNFKRFDDKWCVRQCLKYGLAPPSPYKIVDTLLESRKLLRIPSHRMVEVAKFLKCDAQKSSHAKFPGHMLWVECMAGNNKAWQEMEDYNRQDVVTNEDVYLKLRPYMRNHPNVGVYQDEEETVCPKCGSKHIHFRGHSYTQTGKFRQFQCQDCGGWGRLRESVRSKSKRKSLSINA